MTRALPFLLVALVAACDQPAPRRWPLPPSSSAPSAQPEAPASLVSAADTKALTQQGGFPPGPELDVFTGKCGICHSTSYISQQRLTPSQWEKTIKKMRDWGSPVTDEEVTRLTAYFATHFPADLGPPRLAVVAPPPCVVDKAAP